MKTLWHTMLLTLVIASTGACTRETTGTGNGTGTSTGDGTGETTGTNTSTDAPDLLGAPVFSPPGGPFFGSVQVEISVGHSEAEIHYTLDGSAPGETSTLYDGAITLDDTTIVRARGFVDGLDPGPPGSQAYLLTNPDLESFSSNLPIVVIDSLGYDINSESGSEGNRPTFPRRLVYGAFFDAPAGGRASITDVPGFSGRAGMKVRGNSSQILAKKQYSFEVWDEDDLDRDAAVLGMPAESDWVFHAPYGDKALMRNHLAYTWSNDLGFYAPRTRHVELFFNWRGDDLSMDDYVGVYLFLEKIKRGEHRVDIAKLDPGDLVEPAISGGYILKVDVPDEDEEPFHTSQGTPGEWTGFIHVYPRGEVIADAQHQWLLGFLDRFEDALYGPQFADPVGGYRDHADVSSFVHYHLLTEALKNADSFYASEFMHKDRGGKLTMGPIWDWNVSFGGTSDWETWEPTGWLHEQVGPMWFERLFEDPGFRQAWRDRWEEARGDVLSTERLVAEIDATAALLDEAQERNFARWPILGQSIEELPHLDPEGWDERDTYAKEVEYLRTWLIERLDWIDANLDSLPNAP